MPSIGVLSRRFIEHLSDVFSHGALSTILVTIPMPQTRLDTICTVTCYKQPDYVRSVTLAQGLKQGKAFTHVVEVRNKSTGFWRYGEVFWQLLRVRFTQNPGT